MPEKFEFSSSKCDFRVRSQDFSIGGTVEGLQSKFASTLPRVSVSAASDKCDWRVTSKDSIVEMSAQLSGETVRARLAKTAASDKCDWRFIIEQEEFTSHFNMSNRAALVRFGSAKCDFRVDTGQGDFRGSVAAVPGE